ncbi:hypothetical protein JCGZ_00758 [Jatropha curcas]|uniref:Uncharacterized protein n=1 Tax=Jatropha curcas TaxID=180498 RepID=A0A067KRZ8_JATCU|nr:hypothetical protein JCGZ_00758 [Jatropha curcas]
MRHVTYRKVDKKWVGECDESGASTRGKSGNIVGGGRYDDVSMTSIFLGGG